MLLGQVAVELRGKHIDQTSGIFQQRLFHPTSNLDGNIVRELGKMAAKTGVSIYSVTVIVIPWLSTVVPKGSWSTLNCRGFKLQYTLDTYM